MTKHLGVKIIMSTHMIKTFRVKGKKARHGNWKTDLQCSTMVSGIPWEEVELIGIGDQRPWLPTLIDQCELSPGGEGPEAR